MSDAAGGRGAPAGRPAAQVRARIVFLIRVPAERAHDFLTAYEKIRYEVAEGVPGHLVDQVCQSPADPEQWLITSEWESLGTFEAWERSPGHRELVRPMRECMTEARSLRFAIRLQTTRRQAGRAPAQGPAGLT
ncbi:MAG TPA: antibiotic biosynthesis monooxygenase family protein [Streptosporangiaceae bacterium]|nr:antibiotic biosynthesis monooxygenase family protein [Streptosporangiaceae bacterium]